MVLSSLDWFIIIGYFILSFSIGLYYSRGSGNSLSDFFLGGRNLSWLVAGVSMVATTFAADTPLAVTELVAKNGIAGNWLWWSFLAGGMLTTFFFARLWRRAEVLTEVELIELRYGGAGASWLRGFKSVYLGLFMNTIILAWVNLAMVSIFRVFFNVDDTTALLLTGGAMLITAIYSSISGLMGVAITGAVQFGLAMLGCIILAILVVYSPQIGGIDGLKMKLAERSPDALSFFPTIGSNGSSIGTAKTLALSVSAFFAYVGVQWWAAWYPGAEPGGGGYVAQRMMSARSEKDAVFATLLFQVAHYCVRPWPWILVGLCAIILYPELPEKDIRLGYVYAMKEFLPSGLRGMLLVAFLAAYMSTVSTQLNWGASYLVNDLYKRFFRPLQSFGDPNSPDERAADQHYVWIGRLATLILMVLGLLTTTQIDSISDAWAFVMQCGAGLGLVLILRWYWWRINVWSEISATAAPFVAAIILRLIGNKDLLSFPNEFLFTVGFTTVVWITVTMFTKPETDKVLRRFYDKVRPDGVWTPFQNGDNTSSNTSMRNLLVCWLSSITMTYSTLFCLGKFIFKEWTEAAIWLAVAAVTLWVLRIFINKTSILD